MILTYIHPDLPGYLQRIKVGDGVDVRIVRPKDLAGKPIYLTLILNGREAVRINSPIFCNGQDPFFTHTCVNDGPGWTAVLQLQSHNSGDQSVDFDMAILETVAA